VSLNAPKNKASVAANYRNEATGWSGEIRGRWVEGFPVNSGVFVGSVESYNLMDVSATYDLAFARGTLLTVAATNLWDNRHREFVGVPAIGRLVYGRLSRTF
jgi:iron complex outermembrane receptor protein